MLQLMVCVHFRISLDDENPSRASHDADPEYLRLHPHAKTRIRMTRTAKQIS
jgi:predicted Zn-dependent protease